MFLLAFDFGLRPPNMILAPLLDESDALQHVSYVVNATFLDGQTLNSHIQIQGLIRSPFK